MKYPKGCNLFCRLCWWTCQYHKTHGKDPICKECYCNPNDLNKCVFCDKSVCSLGKCSKSCDKCFGTLCNRCTVKCHDWICTSTYCPNCQLIYQPLELRPLGERNIYMCKHHLDIRKNRNRLLFLDYLNK